MGISTNANAETEEITLLPPTVTLPLDITKFISGWTQSGGVPPSLVEFYTLSSRLHQHLGCLPARDADIAEYWVSQNATWSREVAEILEDMRKITHRLLITRPVDLRGNFHPIEEYESDIASTLQGVQRILGPLRRSKTKNEARIAKALVDIRKIYMFQEFHLRR